MKINEIFYSIQGEGYHAGTPAVFVRFSGCNLRCPFCDTKHLEHVDMDANEVLAEILQYPADLVVFTGGEPSLQLSAELVNELHAFDKTVAVETNGTRELPVEVDFVTLSPKFEFVDHAAVAYKRANELKVVWTGENIMAKYDRIKADHYYLQPCDTGDKQKNAEIIAQVVDYCKRNPKWHISLQTQKIINVR